MSDFVQRWLARIWYPSHSAMVEVAVEWLFAVVYTAAIGLSVISVTAKVAAELKYPYWSRDWWRLVNLAFNLLVAGVLSGLVAVTLADNKAQVLVVAICVLVAVLALCSRAIAEGICKLAFIFASKSYIASLKARRATARKRLCDTID